MSIRYDKLFLEPPDGEYDRLQIDRESVSYITTPHNALQILWIIKSNIKDSNITIFDGTAGVGGDLIVFAHVFSKVIGCEIDADRFNMLKNNVEVYDLINVELINSNSIDIMFNMNVDVVYLDPPWGGRSYKNHNKLTLSMNDMPIEQIVNKLFNKLVVLKLPLNYDLRYLYRKTYKTCKKRKMLLYRLEKMLIIVFKSTI